MLKLKNLSKALLCIALLATGKIASAQKVGFVNYDSILYLLPEIKNVRLQLDSLQQYYSDQLEGQKAELISKSMKLDSNKARMTPKELEIKEGELQQMQQRIQTYSELYRENITQTQESLLKPLNLKVRKVIEEVAKEKGFSSIVDKQVAYYFNPADDLTALVMKKLNIVIPPPMPPGGGIMAPPRR
ncbi:MAG: OmpH family outer membrane protein [Bacteroidota bacterium]|nr:OmpH family outer membrane protein [Bacteroidota bacterium]